MFPYALLSKEGSGGVSTVFPFAEWLILLILTAIAWLLGVKSPIASSRILALGALSILSTYVHFVMAFMIGGYFHARAAKKR